MVNGIPVDITREHVSDYVIENLRRELRRYASARKQPVLEVDNRSTDPFGVSVMFNRKNPHLVRFSGVTHDDIVWVAEVDFRAYSRDYHDAVINGVGKEIDNKRRERRGRGPIVLLDEISDLEMIH